MAVATRIFFFLPSTEPSVSHARMVDDKRESVMPCTILARVFALSGAMTVVFKSTNCF